MDGASADVILLVHALATAMMLGVIWTVQVVHYPLFARVPAEAFCAYERAHMRRISVIVGPAMVAELATAGWIAADPAGMGVTPWMAWVGAALVAINWVSTATMQGPMHQRLSHGKDDVLIRRLVATNWVRTIAWSARAVLAVAMVADAPGG
jgi:hypothetical protein